MKNKKAQAEVIVSGVVAVVVGVLMIPVLASLIDNAQVIKSIGLEQVTNTAFNQSFILDNLDLVAGTIVVFNGTCADIITTGRNCTLTDGNEFSLVERTAALVIINRTGLWNISYDYEPTTYVDSAIGRTVILNVTLMYAVGMIILVLAVVGIKMFGNK